MDLLVIGANGLLGSNVVQVGLDQGWTVSGTYHSTEPDFDIPLSQLDITETGSVHRILEARDPDWVVNCAAMTDVDGCEETPNAARTVNAQAPGGIAAHCHKHDRGFLHVSTDYVFDGDASRAYSEDAPTNPIQVYGQSKLDGEKAVRAVMSDALITRLSFVYGVHKGTDELTGFPAWVRYQLRTGTEIPLFTDQHVTPSRAGETAETLLELIAAGSSGTFNVACRSCVSPYDFGSAISDEMDVDDGLLSKGTQSDIDRPAPRPKNTCLDVTKLEERLGRAQPTLDSDLAAISEHFVSNLESR